MEKPTGSEGLQEVAHARFAMSKLHALIRLHCASALPQRASHCGSPWLWRDATSATSFLSCVTRSFTFGFSRSFAAQDGRVVRGTVLCSACSESGLSGDRKLGAGMEVHVEDTSLGAVMSGAGSVVEDDGGIQSPKLLTLVIVKKDEKVLLGMKKRGFGAGYFNGFGGKVEANETIYEAAVRELQEESGVVPVSMEKRGILTFHFDDNPQPWEVHVFHVGDYAGEPCETEEMAPRWFSLADIPYDKMWQDDPIWYPEFLHGRLFKGDFYFHDTHTLVSHTLHVLQKLDA